MIIYKTINILNNKIYVGQDSKNNPYYFGSGKIIKNIIKKYGKSILKKEILCECKSFEELDKMEIFYIKKLKSNNPSIGYNLTIGGSGISDEKKNKLRKASKKHKHSKETIEKLKIINTGKNNFNWGKKRPDHVKIKNSKPVIAINKISHEIEKFISIRDCAKWLNVNSGNIMRVLKKERKSCKNYYIYYESEYLGTNSSNLPALQASIKSKNES